jgi:hypothetical protein
MSEMELIGLRQFREKLDTLVDPVQVIKTRGKVTVLGTWIPHGDDWEVTQEVGDDFVAYHYKRKVSSKR